MDVGGESSKQRRAKNSPKLRVPSVSAPPPLASQRV